MHMEEKHISDKLSYISELFLEILVMQVRSLYEEYNEKDLDEFEIEYRAIFRNLVRKKICEEKLAKLVKKFLLLEADQYGLDKTENNIKCALNGIFTEIGIELSVESIIIKENWKREQVGNLKDEVFNLRKLIEQLNMKVYNLNNSISNYKKEKINLQCNINKIKEKMRLAEIDINEYKRNNEMLIEENNKLKLNLDQTKSNIKLENKLEVTKQYNILKEEIDKLKNECEHFRKGISILKSQNREGISLIENLKKENDKITRQNEDLKVLSIEKEEYIKQLEIKINKLKQNEVKLNKISIEEIHKEHESINKELVEKLSEMINKSKILNGKNIMRTASEINKFSRGIKNINERSKLSESINKLRGDLIQLNNLFDENGKEAGLKICIDKLERLESKI